MYHPTTRVLTILELLQAHPQMSGAELAEQRPGDAVLSEEGADDPVRLRSQRVWIVDPLDGTREFSEPPRDDWAVHVALWQDGELIERPVDQAVPGPVRHRQRAQTATGWSVNRHS